MFLGYEIDYDDVDDGIITVDGESKRVKEDDYNHAPNNLRHISAPIRFLS
jgi:hypothetical protein